MIDLFFTVEEARKIKLIPIPWWDTRDRFFWNWSGNGLFTLRSAYHRLQEVKLADVPGSSLHGSFPWKRLWHACVPAKIKHFVHKLASNVLPCRSNLARKGIMVQHECPLCLSQVEENLQHVFLECNWTRASWFSYSASIHSDVIQAPVRDWLADCLLNFEENQVVAVLSDLYAIWKARNEAVFNDVIHDPGNTMAAAGSLTEWSQAHEKNSSVSDSAEDHCDRWQAPVGDTPKVNVDVGCSGQAATGFGMVLRGQAAEFMYVASDTVGGAEARLIGCGSFSPEVVFGSVAAVGD